MSHLSTYVGIFLDQNSKGLLNKLRTFVPKDWVWYGDHMTIKYFGAPTYPEDFPEPYDELATTGKEVKLVVSHIGISDNAIAVKVDGYPLESQTAHITLATPMGGSPSQSKNITNWKKIKPFTLHGTIMGNGDAGEQVMGEEDLTSDTLVPFKGERRDELDGRDYLETVWAAPTMHVKYGGNMTENVIKKLVTEKLVTEVGTGTAKPYSIGDDQEFQNYKSYQFMSEDKDIYYVTISQEWNPFGQDYKWRIVFGVKNHAPNVEMNKGRVYRVMATLMKIISDFFKAENPEDVTIVPAKKDESDNRRMNLYMSYIQKNLPPEYKVDVYDDKIHIRRLQTSMNEITSHDVRDLVGGLHNLFVTPDGKAIPVEDHASYLQKTYPNIHDRAALDQQAYKDGYIRIVWGAFRTHGEDQVSFSAEGTNRTNLRNAVNAYMPFLLAQRSSVFIEDPTSNYYTFELPQHRFQLEEFLETGKYDRRTMNEAVIARLVLKELTTTFPFNVGSVENTYQSWTDTAGDANKSKLNTNNVELQEIARVDITKFPFVQALEKAGGKVYQVGGYTRDEILGKESKDLDIVVSGLKDTDVIKILTRFGTLAQKSGEEGTGFVGQSFSVIKFKPFGEAEDIDIALARIDTNTGDRYKDVKTTISPSITIYQDLARRDITINSIAKDTKGNIIDPYNGREDLKNGIIRMVTPQSFPEDPVRILRAIQFASRFHFKIEPATYQSMKDNAYRVAKETGERLVIEFGKMIYKGDPKECAQYMVDTGVYNAIFQTDFKGTFDDFAKVKRMSEFVFLLAKDSIQSPSAFWMERLKGDEITETEIKAFEYTRADIKTPADQRWLLSKIEELYRTHPEGRVQNAIGSFVVQDKIGDVSKHPAEKYPRMAHLLPLTSQDIAALGIKGTNFGKLKADLMDLVYNDQIPNTREAMLNYAQQNIDKYKTDTPKKIKEIAARLLKEYYGQGAIDKLEKSLFRYYQEAYDVRNAAYITPSGRLLSMVPRDGRSRDDHRSIGSIMQDLNIDLGQYNTPKWEHSETKWMYLAMDLGFIRTMPESHNEADLDMRTAPTGDQMTRIEELVNAHNGRTVLDLRDGDREASIMYEWETPTEWVMEEIRRFYYYGENPRPWRGYGYEDEEEDLMEIHHQPKHFLHYKYWFDHAHLPADLKDRLNVGTKPTPQHEMEINDSKKLLGHDPHGVPVYTVNGELVRQYYYPDFSLGGNDMAYPNFIPKNEIWVDQDLKGGNRETTINHESLERHEMYKLHKFYDVGSGKKEHGAHVDALGREHDIRAGKVKPIQLTKEPPQHLATENIIAKLTSQLLEARHENYKEYDVASKSPIKDTETLVVYHGFSSHSRKEAMLAIRYGLSGKYKAPRIYSYESVNNPKGLFVSINFDKVKKEFAGSGIIIEFATKVSNLEAPVWAGGGSYFVQGEYTKSFANDEERETQRLQNRERDAASKYPAIAQSNRPELAQTLFQNVESQALFIGDLNPNMIRAVWVNEELMFNQRINGSWERMNRVDFLRRYYDPSAEEGESYYRQPDKIFKPNDDFDITRFKEFLAQHQFDYDRFVEYYIKNWDHYIMYTYFYPKQIEQIRKYYNVTESVVKALTQRVLQESICDGNAFTPNIIQKFTKQQLQEIAMKSRQNQLKRLVVFDMDHTLLTSPMPEFGREEWKEKTGEEYPHKKAWWSTPESLDADVFDIKAIAPVFNQMRDEQRRSDTMVVVMTNRLDTLEKEVRRVMKLNRINPDQLSMAEYAMQNKGDRILQILQDNPSIKYVAFYDDQEKNIMDVRNALKKKGITYDLYNCQDGKIRRT